VGPTIQPIVPVISVQCNSFAEISSFREWYVMTDNDRCFVEFAPPVATLESVTDTTAALSPDACARTSRRLTFAVKDRSLNWGRANITVVESSLLAPKFSHQATSLTVGCDHIPALTAVNQWIASHGGAVASDPCLAGTTTTTPPYFSWTHN